MYLVYGTGGDHEKVLAYSHRLEAATAYLKALKQQQADYRDWSKAFQKKVVEMKEDRGLVPPNFMLPKAEYLPKAELYQKALADIKELVKHMLPEPAQNEHKRYNKFWMETIEKEIA